MISLFPLVGVIWFFWFCSQCRASAPHPCSFPELPDGCRTWSHLRAAPQNRHWLIPSKLEHHVFLPSFSNTFSSLTRTSIVQNQLKALHRCTSCMFVTDCWAQLWQHKPHATARAELIRIYTDKAEHIIWALYRRLTVRRHPWQPSVTCCTLWKWTHPAGFLWGN